VGSRWHRPLHKWHIDFSSAYADAWNVILSDRYEAWPRQRLWSAAASEARRRFSSEISLSHRSKATSPFSYSFAPHSIGFGSCRPLAACDPITRMAEADAGLFACEKSRTIRCHRFTPFQYATRPHRLVYGPKRDTEKWCSMRRGLHLVPRLGGYSNDRPVCSSTNQLC